MVHKSPAFTGKSIIVRRPPNNYIAVSIAIYIPGACYGKSKAGTCLVGIIGCAVGCSAESCW